MITQITAAPRGLLASFTDASGAQPRAQYLPVASLGLDEEGAVIGLVAVNFSEGVYPYLVEVTEYPHWRFSGSGWESEVENSKGRQSPTKDNRQHGNQK
jgi:hypothetical protein